MGVGREGGCCRRRVLGKVLGRVLGGRVLGGREGGCWEGRALGREVVGGGREAVGKGGY